MKTIKIIPIILLCLIYTSSFSQDNDSQKLKKYEIDVANPASSKLKLINLAGDVEIIAGNSNKIIVEANGIEPKPERADGLKRVGAGGEDNTGTGLNLTKNGNDIQLYGAVSMHSDVNYKITVPKNLKIYVELGIFNHGDLDITGLSTDIELDVKNSDIKLKDITGPTVISSLSGDINLVFSTVNQSSPFSIKAISGDIDLSIPSNTPANLELSSMSGGIYTDFDLQNTDKSAGDLNYVGGGSKVRSKINGGGVNIMVSAISGNIYLRKKK